MARERRATRVRGWQPPPSIRERYQQRREERREERRARRSVETLDGLIENTVKPYTPTEPTAPKTARVKKVPAEKIAKAKKPAAAPAPAPVAAETVQAKPARRARVEFGEDRITRYLERTMQVVARSQKSFKDIHLDGGPTPATLERWKAKQVRRPRMDTVYGALLAAGGNLQVLDQDGVPVNLSEE